MKVGDDKRLGDKMEEMKLACTLDGAEYKEYEVLINDRPIGVISWKGDRDVASSWYTTASDGNPRYFHNQEEAIEFLINKPLESNTELSERLKSEANNLLLIAEELEAKSADLKE